MANPKSIPGFDSPAAGFDEPFEILDAYHHRLHRSLELVQRLQRHLVNQGADEQARQAALDVLRYFTIASPLHHEDEERHVVPLLLQTGQDALVKAAEQVMQDHVQICSVWRSLEPMLREIVNGENPDRQRLADTVRKFVRLNESHLAFENGVVFPKARELTEGKGSAALAAMGHEMAQRRRAA